MFQNLTVSEWVNSERFRHALLVDVRSSAEFDEHHMPHAVNFPILSNEERHRVGWLYKQVGKGEAFNEALTYAVPKLSQLRSFVRDHLAGCPGHKTVVVHCWRGGGRSGHVARFLESDCGSEVDVFQLEGGIKAFRRHVQTELNRPEFYPPFLVISGKTGVGKSKFLEALRERGIDVLHLEEIACHMSSVFGQIPYARAIGQKQFETNLFENMMEIHRRRDSENRDRAVLIESESRRIGHLMLPEVLDRAIHDAKHIELNASLSYRCQRLIEDYVTRVEDGVSQSRGKLKFIENRLGTELFQKLDRLLQERRIQEFCEMILPKYYDKVYKSFPRPAELRVDYEKDDELMERAWPFIEKNFLSRNT